MSLVLVTGATGEVARGVLPFLEKEFDLRLLSADALDDPRHVRADLLDWDALARAMSGVDAVLHLAVASGHPGPYEEDAFNDLRFDVNVKGTYHVFETAQRLRVKRVVHVSSLMVVWGYALLEKWPEGSFIRGDAEPLPVGTYALTKALAEGIARQFGVDQDLEQQSHLSNWSLVRAGGNRLEVITVRIAAPLDLTAPGLRDRVVRPQQVPFPDLAQAFVKALKVRLSRYEVVTIVGECGRRLWDLEPARRILGYRPTYNLDDLGVTFADPFFRD